MSKTKYVGGLAVVLALASSGRIPSAQTPNRDPLATATRIDCVFPVLATGTWSDGVPHAEVKPAKLAFAFDSIDTQEGTARAIGDFGPSQIVARLSWTTLHLLQVSSDGPVYITTVFNKVTHDGKLMAVHTRHEYTDVSLPGFTSRPEQYYGECQVKQ